MNSVIRNRCVGSPALRARRAVRLLALQAVMLLGLSVAAATPASAQSEIAVQRIQIEGAQRIEEATIRSYLNVNEGDSVGAAEINEALKRLVATGLFSDVELTPGSDGVLVVQVVENPIINFIAFEGNGSIEDEVLQAQIRTRPRTAFTRARAEADAQTIIAIYRAAGRYSTTVEPKIIQKPENRVDLVFEITEGDVVGIAAVNFVGNTEYSDRRLRGVIETEESAWWKLLSSSDSYDPDRLEFDKELLRRFYFARGFADFEVVSAVAELNPERDEFFITFTVNEGEEYTVGEVGLVSNTRGLEAEQFEDLLLTDSGDTYDADLVEKSIGRIQRVMGEEGINFVDVRPRANKRRDENDEPIIDLTYELNEGQRVYVERIDVEGNIRTLDRVIRREFELVEGDAFNAY
ncbi:MAG: outer membrane protein assembly factor BamA, partial [Pseudomonadota bacterium]